MIDSPLDNSANTLKHLRKNVMKNQNSGGSFFVRIAGIALLLLAASGDVSGQASAPAQERAHADPPFKVQFDHATISVADVETEANFYMQKLGFSASASPNSGRQPQNTAPPAQSNAKPTHRRLSIPGLQLDLTQYQGSERPKMPSNALQQQGIAYLAFSVSDLDAALNSIKAAGIETEPSHNPQGKVVGFMFHDPEGNPIEFFTY